MIQVATLMVGLGAFVLRKAWATTPGPVREMNAPAMYEPRENSIWAAEVTFSATSKPDPVAGTKSGAGATDVTSVLTP